MKDYKILIATRHLKRVGDTENITPEELYLAKELKNNIDLVVKDFKIDQKAIVSGYKTIGDNLGRTQNTAAAFGYNQFILESGLAYSPNEWQNIPFGKDFVEYIKKYYSRDPGTMSLVDTHANLYQKIVSDLLCGNGKHIFTHDSRIEAACAKLMTCYVDRMGAALDNGESVVMLIKDSYKFSPLAIVRRDGIKDIY